MKKMKGDSSMTALWNEQREQEDDVEPYEPGYLSRQIHPLAIQGEDIPQFIYRPKFLPVSRVRRVLEAVAVIGTKRLEYAGNASVQQARVYPSEIGADIYDRYGDEAVRINSTWQFHLSGWFESMVYLEYHAGDYNAMHTDSTHTDRTKIGFTTLLSEHGVDFEGGELEFLKYGVATKLQKPGDTAFFPGYLAHQVHPVTKGVRKTLTGWLGGPPWC